MGNLNERERDKLRKRKKRAAENVVKIPQCKDRKRRERLEKDDIAWLMWYFHPESGSRDPYTYEFTFQQREMAAAIKTAIETGDDQALAASRGEGKTTLFERLLLKYSLSGQVKLSVLFAATGGNAQDSLGSIRTEVETNLRLKDDYPEVCVPVAALENHPNRAHFQSVSGKRHDNGEPYSNVSSKFSWCGQEISFPNVPGSPSAGAIIATRGLDSAVRGLKKGGRRVDVAGIDDPDTEETVNSQQQAEKLEKRIDRGIAGLGSQKRRVARVMLTTLQNRNCTSFKFTDPNQKPNFKGRRFRFLIKKPDRMDLWEEYIDLKKLDWKDGTDKAHEFYVANRDAMDAGAEVANPNRYSHGELSALQFYFNEVARIGPEAVAAEYDNDPIDESEINESQITASLVGRRISGLAHKELPANDHKLVAFVDVMDRFLSYTECAWTAGETGSILDYGNPQVDRVEDKQALELAVIAALHKYRADILEKFVDSQGNKKIPDLVLIDSGDGDHTNAVYQFCSEAGPPFMPSKGFASFRQHNKAVKSGDNWAIERLDNKQRTRLVEFNSTYWRRRAHQRFVTPAMDEKTGQRFAGSLALFICPEQAEFRRRRMDFCKQVVAEVWGIKKPGAKPGFMALRTANHFLDCCAGICLAADIAGERIIDTIRPRPIRRSLSEMAAAAKQKAS